MKRRRKDGNLVWSLRGNMGTTKSLCASSCSSVTYSAPTTPARTGPPQSSVCHSHGPASE
eukprot:2772266-Rhodomonas_salina.1